MAFRIFLDTANVDEIRDAVSTGIIDGIATNPNKMAQVGRRYIDVINDIREFFSGPIAVEAISQNAGDIIAEARELSKMAENIVIKIPTNKEGIKAISVLVPEGVITNSTLIFNPAQALAAGLANSPFISPFIGRVNCCGQDGMALFREVRKMYDAYDIKSVVIAASIKNCREAVDAVIAGADALALTYEVFSQFFEHPLTDIGIEKFTADFNSVNR